MKSFIIYLVFVLLLSGCQVTRYESSVDEIVQPETHLEVAFEIVKLLKDQDFSALSMYIHPYQGVRLSPYAYIDLENHFVLSKDQISNIRTNSKLFNFGTYAGNGYPIELTFQNYYNEFIFDLDYTNPQLIGNGVFVGTGSTLNNLKEVYPDLPFVEFHFTDVNPEFEGMDWRSLRIVLEKDKDSWYLVGIIHDEWTS